MIRQDIPIVTVRCDVTPHPAKATSRDLYGHIMQHYASRMQNISRAILYNFSLVFEIWEAS